MPAAKRVLITGSSGFTGRHLVALLSRDSTLELHTADHSAPKDPPPRFHTCDLENASLSAKLIKTVAPQEIYHLVGSYTNVYDTDYASNVVTTRNILDTVVKFGMNTKVLLVGSSAEYGFPERADKAVAENHPCKPVSIYGLVKLFETELMRTYVRLYGLSIVAVRPFNLFGKGMSPRLFVGKMEQDIAKYKRGKIQKIITGDLSVERDYLDVEMAVLYYATVMRNGKTGEVYNVGSGRVSSLRDVLLKMLGEAGLSMKIVEESTHSVPGKIVVPKLFADTTKIKKLR